MSEDKDVVSFRYAVDKDDEIIYVKFIQLTDSKIEMNMISSK